MFKLNSGVSGLLALLSTLTIPGCRGDDPGTSESASSTGDSNSTSGTPTTTTNTPTTTGDESTTSGSTTTGDTPTTTGEPASSTTDNSGNFLTTQTSDGGDTGGAPNGSMCGSDDDCASMNCISLIAGMVQFCGDCNEDTDCTDAGTGTACTISIADQSSECTDGPPGSTCMSDDACMGEQICDNVLDTPILPNTCGECSDSGDCDMGKLCSPALDIMMASGNKTCVEPGSVQNDQLCPSGNDGNDVCMSGHCTQTNLLGIVPVNICGECEDDADCPMPGQTCTDAEASMTGFSGSVCT